MPPTKLIRHALAVAGAGTLLAAVALPAAHAGDGWQSAGKGKTAGISGIALASAAGAGDTVRTLVVRDNKEPDENRVAAVDYREGEKPDVTPLGWKGGAPPSDLEALARVPGEKNGYVAVASSGTAYHVEVSDGAARVEGSFTLPALGLGDEVESFALAVPPSSGESAQAAREGKLVALWADRGGDDDPATLHAATVSLGKGGRAEFGDVSSEEVSAPYPEDDVRHASDAALTDSGEVVVSSASDPGDDGPFDSAVYAAGHVSVGGSGEAELSVAEKPKVREKFGGHKVEAFACLPGSGKAVLGTDDENDGGALTTAGGICDG